MKYALVLSVVAILILPCCIDMSKTPKEEEAEISLSDEIYYISMLPDEYCLSITYQFTARNKGDAQSKSIEFSVNPGFFSSWCYDIHDNETTTINCTTQIYEGDDGALKRNLTINRALKPNESITLRLYVYGCPIDRLYTPSVREEVSDLSLSMLINSKYRSQENKKIYLTVPDPMYPVVLDEGTEEFVEKEPFYSGMDHSSTFNYTAKSSFRACIADFAYLEQEKNGITCKVYLAPSDKDLLPWVMNVTFGALEIYSEKFYPYPYKEYTVLASDRNRMTGGGNGFANYTIYNTIGSYYLLVHEIGHAWFGGLVEQESDEDEWLSEGGAVYCETLMGEEENREDLREHLNDIVRDYMYGYSDEEGTIAEGYKNDSRIIYEKGGMVFRMLQHVMGNEAFFRFMREFFNKFHGSKASINDFVSLANEYEDLDWFFDEWLYRSGAPDYTITNVSYDGKRVTCEIRQNQEKLYRMVMEIGLIMEEGSEIRQKVWVNETAETVSFEVNGKPSKLILDPDIWVLKYYDVKTEDPETKWTYLF